MTQAKSQGEPGLVDLQYKQGSTNFEAPKALTDALTLNISYLAQQQKVTAANIDALRHVSDSQNSAIAEFWESLQRKARILQR